MWTELIGSHPPPLFMRFLKRLGRGINAHRMITHGDRVLVSVSGGTDPLVLALGLRMRLRSLTNIDHEYLP